MRTRCLIVLLLCCITPALHAEPEWILAGGKNDGSFRIYFRADVKRLPNGLSEGWELFDYKASQFDADLKIIYRSQIWLQTFNCKERSAATFALEFYSDSMGKGTMLRSMKREPDQIKFIRPAAGSPAEFMVNKICS